MTIEVPGDLILPEPTEQKEVDLNRALQDNSVQVRNALVAASDTQDKVKASATDPTAGYLDAKVDDSSIEVASEVLQVKALGIATGMLSADSVDKTKIAADVAGLGITQAVGGELDVNVDDSSIEIATDTVQVKANGVTTLMLEDDLVFGTFPLTPSAAPDADYEVANKKYVDDEVGGISTAMTLKSTTVISGAVNSGDIPITAGKRYKIYIRLTAISADSILQLRFNSDSTATRYAWNRAEISLGGTASSAADTSDTEIELGLIDADDNTGSWILDVNNDDVGNEVFVSGSGAFKQSDNSGTVGATILAVYNNAGTDATSFEIFTGTGTITGNIKTYEIT